MERKTLDMFVSTCNYLSFLIDDILSCNSEIQLEAFTSVNAAVTVNDLMSKLFVFMNHLCRNQPVGGSSSSGSVNGGASNIASNVAQPILADNSANYKTGIGANDQFNSPQPLMSNLVASNISYVNPSSGPIHSTRDNGQPVQNYNRISDEHNIRANPIPAEKGRNLTDRPLGIDQPKIRLVPAQTTGEVANQKVTSNNKDKKSTKEPLNHVENKSLAKEEKTTIAANNKDQKADSVKQPVHVESKLLEEKKLITGDVCITKLFLGYIDAIADGLVTSNNIGIYCRICDVLCMKSWSDHVNEQNHVDKKGNLRKLKMYSCRICRICLYGSKSVIIKYFEFHFRKIHSNKTDLCWEECLIETECLDSSKNSSKASSMTSLNKCDLGTQSARSRNVAKKKKNKGLEPSIKASTVNVNTQQSTTCNNKTKSTNAQTTLQTPNPTSATQIGSQNPTPSVSRCSSTSSVGSKTRMSSPPLNEVHTASKNSSLKPSQKSSKNPNRVSPVSPTDPVLSKQTGNSSIPASSYPAFDFILSHALNAYIRSSLKVEVGYCTECQKYELSYFDWFDHVENHNGGLTELKEEICPTCGIHVYGSDHKKYFSLPGHLKLDKVVGKC